MKLWFTAVTDNSDGRLGMMISKMVMDNNDDQSAFRSPVFLSDRFKLYGRGLVGASII